MCLSAPCTAAAEQPSLPAEQCAEGDANTQLLAGLQRVADAHKLRPGLRVMVGVNANLDLITQALPTFKLANVEPADAGAGAGAGVGAIDSMGALSSTFFDFFSSARAGERTMSDGAGFEALVRAARQVPGHQIFPGGNAALMARKFAAEGCAVTLAGPAGAQLEGMLAAPAPGAAPRGAAWAAGGSLSLLSGGARSGQAEDVHLILEYAKGDAWGGAMASRGNRFILNRGNEELISHLHGFEEMAAHIQAVSSAAGAGGEGEGVGGRPQLLVISGLNIMENHTPAFRSAKVAMVRDRLLAINGGRAPGHAATEAAGDDDAIIPTHLELASVADDALVRDCGGAPVLSRSSTYSPLLLYYTCFPTRRSSSGCRCARSRRSSSLWCTRRASTSRSWPTSSRPSGARTTSTTSTAPA
jgi:hypothetical protein